MVRHQKCEDPSLDLGKSGVFPLNHSTLLFVGSACLLGLFLLKMLAGGETYAPETEVSFLSSLVSPSPAAQPTATDVWSDRMSAPAEAELQSAMASRASRLLPRCLCAAKGKVRDRKSTRLNSSHSQISYAVFCLKKKKRDRRSSQVPNLLLAPTLLVNTGQISIKAIRLSRLSLTP